MSIRDSLLALLLIGGLPVSIMRPFVGALFFVWLGTMNPHRYTWGFAYDFPWSKLYALAVVVGVMVSKESQFRDSTSRYRIVLMLLAWMAVTTVFSLEPLRAWSKYADVLKIQLMCLVTLSLLTTRARITALVTVMTLSLAFYGTKGGVFTLAHGGVYTVWGPVDTAIQDNNHLAAALVMLLPLLYWLFRQARPRWQKIALIASLLLCAVSVFGSQSRGAFLAVGAMALFFLLKSDRKLLAIPLIAFGVIAAAIVMPDSYWQRIDTIHSYEEDGSAMGRINTWKTAFNIANHRVTGAGFEYYSDEAFARYAPVPASVHAAHSIYFQALGEHGWIGLLLFLSIWVTVWRQCLTAAAAFGPGPEGDTMRLLLRMIQVSLVAFAVGGAFVNIGNWDFPYYLAIVVFAAQRLASSATPRTERAPGATVDRRQPKASLTFGNVRLHRDQGA